MDHESAFLCNLWNYVPGRWSLKIECGPWKVLKKMVAIFLYQPCYCISHLFDRWNWQSSRPAGSETQGKIISCLWILSYDVLTSFFYIWNSDIKKLLDKVFIIRLDCKQSLFFFRFSKQNARARECRGEKRGRHVVIFLARFFFLTD